MQEPEQGSGESRRAEALDELVRKAAAGDQSAWAELDRELRPGLLAEIERGFPREAAAAFDADDIVQDALVRAAKGLGRFEFRSWGRFKRWVRVLAKSSMVDALKRCGRLRRAGSEVRLGERTEVPDPTAAAEIRSLERRIDLEQALEQLSGRQRAVLRRMGEERSLSEVASEFHLTVSQIRTLEEALRRRLRKASPPG